MPEETPSAPPGEGVPFERIRHPLRTRSLSVHAIADVTPQMRRITFAGDDLADFASPGFDDHIKIVFPVTAGALVRRDYTPRRHDQDARRLTVDFALHENGRASDWAHRPKALAADSAALMAAVRTVELQPRMYVWIAAEARVARALRDYLVNKKGHPSNWIKAAGYWVAGRSDAHEQIA